MKTVSAEPVDKLREALRELPCNLNNDLKLLPACVSGSLSDVKQLLEANEALWEERDHRGFGPIAISSCFGRSDVLDFLLSQRRSLVELNEANGHLLLAPLVMEHIDVLDKLLSVGVDWQKPFDVMVFSSRCYCKRSLEFFHRTAPTKYGLLGAVIEQTFHTRLDFLQMIYAEYDDPDLYDLAILSTLVKYAIQCNNLELFRWLMKSETIDFWQQHGSTFTVSYEDQTDDLLTFICSFGSIELMECFLEEIVTGGTVWDAFELAHESAVHATFFHPHPSQAIKLLMKCGLKLELSVDNNVAIVWMIALLHADSEDVKLVMDAVGDEKRQATLTQLTLGHLANADEIAGDEAQFCSGFRLLIENGASLDSKSLYRAIRLRDRDLATWAVEHARKEDLERIFSDDKTTRMITLACAYHNHLKLLKTLIPHPSINLSAEEASFLLDTVINTGNMEHLKSLMSERLFDLSLTKHLQSRQLREVLMLPIARDPDFHKLILQNGSFQDFYNAVNWYQSDLYVIAISCRFDALLEWLIANASSLPEEYPPGRAFFAAVSLSSMEYFERARLLDPTDVALATLKGKKLLHHAAEHNASIEMIDRILELAPSLIETEDSDGATPLLIAAAHGSIRALKHLLSRGATPDWRNSCHDNAVNLLLISETANIHEVLKELLDTAFPRSMYQVSYIRFAMMHDDPKCLAFLLDDIFPNFAITHHPTSKHPLKKAFEHLNLERIRGMFMTAIQGSMINILLWLTSRFPLAVHRPDRLFWDWRTSIHGVNWEQLYGHDLVGLQLHRPPELDFRDNSYDRTIQLESQVVTSHRGHFGYRLSTVGFGQFKDPLLESCASSFPNHPKIFLRHGASLKREGRCTPLQALAMDRRKVTVFRWLLSKGCSIYEGRPYEGSSTLDLLLKKDDEVGRLTRLLHGTD